METKQILFRSHRAGDIMTDAKGTSITEKQLITWNEYAKIVRSGGTLAPGKQKTFKELTIKKNAPFQLSDTAKSSVRAVWLGTEKGFRKDIKSKYLDKGIFGEESGISLLSEVDKRFYSKNVERVTKGNRSGECDIEIELDPKFSMNPELYKGRKVKIIQDVKCCWDSETFMNADFSKGYEWQGRDYLDLYDADEFWLRYCLIDTPEHLILKEKEWKWREFYADSMTDEEQHDLEEKLKPIYDQIDLNNKFSTNPLYTAKERVKTFKITRDDAIFQKYLDRIPFCLDFYKTIKLNNQFI